MSDDRRDGTWPEDVWNPRGVGNTAGADVATPSSTWNPGGVGNAAEGDEGQADASTSTNTGAFAAGRPASPPHEPVDAEGVATPESSGPEDIGQ